VNICIIQRCVIHLICIIVLIDKAQSIRICDFGFGNVVREQHEVLSTYCGSPFYAAPEMVTATPYRGPPVDLWSCGVILYAMLTGSLPFQGDEMPQLFQKISRSQYSIPPYVTRDASDLIQRLLCRDARDRITAKDCLLHPWLTPPTITRCSLLTSSQLTLSSRLTNFSTRKKVGLFSEESSLSMTTLPDSKVNTTITNTNKSNTLSPIVTVASNNPTPSEKKSIIKTSQFFFRIFRKKVQVAPMSDNIHHEKKVFRSKFVSRFRGFFRSSFQKRIT
jgi:serine/threonine protein kinase